MKNTTGVMLSKSLKTLLGVATAIYIMLPILFLFLYILFFIAMILTEAESSGSPIILGTVMCGVFAFMPLAGILSVAIIIFYIIHLIKNQAANDTYRILTAIGLHLMPYVAIPFYYLVYIRPEQPPAWAQQTPQLAVPAAQVNEATVENTAVENTVVENTEGEEPFDVE